MNLGPCCQEMLENSCQCPNTVIDNSNYCALHLTLKAANKKEEEGDNRNNENQGSE